MTYRRVLPRDLFNEAKLLKCLGQLALIIHDGQDSAGQTVQGLLFMHVDEMDLGFTRIALRVTCTA